MKLSNFFKTLFLFFVVVILFSNLKPAKSQESLYKRLGGYDGIAAVSDQFIARLSADPQLNKFVRGLNVNSQNKLRQHLVDFLCNITGGPCLYLGEDMKTAHTGLKISEAEWDVSAKILSDTLDKFNVGSKEKEEVLGAVTALKGQIVGQ